MHLFTYHSEKETTLINHPIPFFYLHPFSKICHPFHLLQEKKDIEDLRNDRSKSSSPINEHIRLVFFSLIVSRTESNDLYSYCLFLYILFVKHVGQMK